MPYEHLNIYDRKIIKKMLVAEKSMRAIARELGRSVSTIKDEIDRNSGKYWYHPQDAQNKYEERRLESKVRLIDKNKDLKDHIYSELRNGRSPDSISGRLKLIYKTDTTMHVSHESIYSWIYAEVKQGSDLYKYLARGIKKRHRRLNKRKNRLKIPGRVSIHKRPKSIEQRKVKGHWEGDTIVGKGHSGYIATVVERKSYFLKAGIMSDKKPETCNFAILEGLWEIPNRFVKTITFDNGTEFFKHETLKEMLECKTYFADPYSSWQRGRNEHTNGILRRYFPKKMDFSKLTQNDIDEAVDKINNMPRKSLGYKTPYEVFYNLPVRVQT